MDAKYPTSWTFTSGFQVLVVVVDQSPKAHPVRWGICYARMGRVVIDLALISLISLGFTRSVPATTLYLNADIDTDAVNQDEPIASVVESECEGR